MSNIEDWLDKPAEKALYELTDWCLSVRASNVLKGKWGDPEIVTLRDLLCESEASLAKRVHCGQYTVREIKTILNRGGLYLGMHVPPALEYYDFYGIVPQ